MNLSQIDLNLLYVLTMVLEERSATRAAHKLHVTQSAVSNALRRAREVFSDPLVVRRPNGLDPTPRAAALLPALRNWLEEARRMIADPSVFDTATSDRMFSIACSDAVSVTLLRPLLRVLRKRAPHTRLRVHTLDRSIAEDSLVRGTIDLLIGIPPVLPPGHGAELVYRDPMECVVRKGHPSVRTRLTRRAFASLPHVELALFDTVDDRIDRALSSYNLTRTVQIMLPHFASVPLAVVATDCVATLSQRLVQSFASHWPLRVFPPPVALEPIEIRQVWHQRTQTDPAVRFLRSAVLEAARSSRVR